MPRRHLSAEQEHHEKDCVDPRRREKHDDLSRRPRPHPRTPCGPGRQDAEYWKDGKKTRDRYSGGRSLASNGDVDRTHRHIKSRRQQKQIEDQAHPPPDLYAHQTVSISMTPASEDNVDLSCWLTCT